VAGYAIAAGTVMTAVASGNCGRRIIPASF